MFLKGMIRSYRETLEAKPALLDDMFEEDEKDEVQTRDSGS
jgi:hypothetical protein